MIGLPSAVGLFLIAQPAITMLFERGAFDAADTVATAAVLKMYVIGLPAYVITKVYSAAFWARKNTTTPVKISIFGTVLNVALGVTFIFVLGTGVEGLRLRPLLPDGYSFFALLWHCAVNRICVLKPCFTAGWPVFWYRSL